MSEPVNATEYVRLGQILQYLLNPQGTIATTYANEFGRLRRQMLLCNLTNSHGTAAALTGTTVPADKRGITSANAASHWQLMMSPIRQAVFDEAGKRSLIALDTDGVSAKLRQLPTEITLNPSQLNLHHETALCIESGAYRSAIVMAWNLSFDVVRTWIFINHKAEFNAVLSANYQKKGNPFYQQIDHYDDFFHKAAPGERIILEVGFDAQLYGGEIYDHLCQYLRYRNMSAHPNDYTPSRDQTNAYIDHLVDLLVKPPFQ